MSVSITVYLLLLALLAWGGKAARLSSYNDDFMQKDATLSIRGIAAIGVLLHHIAQEAPFSKAGALSFFPYIGYLFVAVFFFCSGYGLIKSLYAKPNYLNTFLKHRLPVLIVPFYVNTVFYALARFLHGDKMCAAQWIASFTGLTLMNRFAWYVVVLFILYAVFYFTYSNVKSNVSCIAIITAAVLVQGATFCIIGHFAWWAGEKNWYLVPGALENAAWWKKTMVTWFHGEWWVNSSIAFPLGIAFATYEKKTLSFIKKHYPLCFIVSILLAAAFILLSLYTQYTVGYWSEFRGGSGMKNKAICYFVQLFEVTSFIIALFILLMKVRTINPVTRFFGSYSLETYLMQPFSLMVLSPINSHLALYTAANIALTVILAIVFKKVNTFIEKRFTSR